MNERLLKYFKFDHLPQRLADMSAKFSSLAQTICRELPPSAERTLVLRDLLTAKDNAVRARMDADEATAAFASAPPIAGGTVTVRNTVPAIRSADIPRDLLMDDKATGPAPTQAQIDAAIAGGVKGG